MRALAFAAGAVACAYGAIHFGAWWLWLPAGLLAGQAHNEVEQIDARDEIETRGDDEGAGA